MKFFVSGTGTGIGKTYFTERLATLLRESGRRVVALKPIETGCVRDPLGVPVGLDATALAAATGRAEDATRAGFHRGDLPLGPTAAALHGEPLPDLPALVAATNAAAAEGDDVLVEGAGGLFVPLGHGATVADLVRLLALPVLLVAPNRLGVLSDVHAYRRAAAAEGIRLAAVILVAQEDPNDRSAETNATLLARDEGLPVLTLARHGPTPEEAQRWTALLTSYLI